MFTDNYIKLQKMLFSSDPNTTTTFKDCAGTSQTVYDYHAPNYKANIGQCMKYGKCRALTATFSVAGSPMNNYPGIYFGTGSTPAKKTDYTLESPITTGLTITNASALSWQNDGNGKYTVTSDFIVRNTTGAEINISEIGAFGPIYLNANYFNNGSSSTWAIVLMERTVLSEPVTIQPNESKLVQYKVTFNQPQ